MTLKGFNDLSPEEAQSRLLSCCGSREWARRVAAERPFATEEELAQTADRVWRELPESEWREAFAAHPRIGESSKRKEKGTDLFSGASSPSGEEQKIDLSPIWARGEQAGTRSASPETLASIADANREYEERFGHIFIVCATGRSAAEMLAAARSRLHNDPRTELAIAAEEQRKITRLRLAKLLESEGA
ncbi:MAG TPA: 2-oxo-4-hydroxy-4-carboxy-5-ureidoimidazoline decarboxylase [Thermoanaerobaculia bacterium]